MYRAQPASAAPAFPKPARLPKKTRGPQTKPPLREGGPSRQAAPPKPRKQARKPEAERHSNRDRPI